MAKATYEVRVEGRINKRWSHWFSDMKLTVRDDQTQPMTSLLVGEVADQAALLGLLQNLYSVGLTLLSVKRVDDADRRRCGAGVTPAGLRAADH